jgi:hypothetical protein
MDHITAKAPLVADQHFLGLEHISNAEKYVQQLTVAEGE